MTIPASSRPQDRQPLSREIGGFLLGLSLGTAAVLGATPAKADVLQVGPDGTVAVRRGAGAVDWIGGAIERMADGSAPAAAGSPSPPMVPAPYAAAVARIAEVNAIAPELLAALVWQESRWRADAVSSAGATGLTQLMPATARALGVDPRDPLANLAGGARYLRRQLDRFDGDVEKALAAYNAGPGRVIRAGGIPAIAETRGYVAAIVTRLATTLGDSK